MRVLSFIFAGGLACACGSTSDSNGGPSQEQIDSFIDRICTAAAPCCASANTTPSPDFCKRLFHTVGGGLIPDLGEACLAEIGSPDGGACFRLGAYPDDPCFQMFTGRYGSGGPGSACQKDSDCSAPPGGTSKCWSKGCQWQSRGHAGDAPCVGNAGNGITLFYGDGSDTQGVICYASDGLFCDISSKPWTCRPFRQVGESCIESGDCASRLCSGQCTDSPCHDVCLAATPLGQSCDSSTCAPGSYCDRTTMPNVCRAPLPTGSACTDNDQCASGNCLNDQCSALGFPQQLLADQVCGHFL